MLSSAASPRACIASAVASSGSAARNTPLTISRTLSMPSCASSLRVRSASRSEEASGRATRTTLVLVARPEASSLREAERTRSELAQLGIDNVRLIVNGVFRAADPDDATALAMQARGEAALESIPAALRGLARVEVPLLPYGLVGVDALRSMSGGAPFDVAADAADSDGFASDSLTELVEKIAAQGKGVVMTMGKGGVGK